MVHKCWNRYSKKVQLQRLMSQRNCSITLLLGLKMFAKSLLTVGVVALLSACGGGGDGGSGSGSNVIADSRPSVALSTSNFDTAGKEVMGGTSNVSNIADFAGFLTGAEVSTGITFVQFLQAKYPQALKAMKQTAYLSGVTVSESEPCSGGGSVTFTGNVRSEVNPSPGDAITLTASNCRDGGATANGSLSLRILNVSGNFDSFPFSMGLEATTADFRASTGTATYQSSGSMTLSVTATSSINQDLAITIPSMVSSVAAGAKTETYQYANYSMTISVRGASTSLVLSGGVNIPSLGGNLVTVQTVQPFTSTTSYPTSGNAIATTAMGGKMRITAASGSQALIELDANSDGTYETSKSVPWNVVF